MAWWVNLAGCVLLVVWLAALLPMSWWALRPRSLLGLADSPAGDADWPRLSVIVPARDEEDSVRQALDSLLAADYPNLEIIAVDDRSRDRTGAIMDELAAGDDRLRVLHVRELPSNWLGKTHAMWRGYQAAGGEWLLFTDGDVIYAPSTLRQAVFFARASGVDHLALFPDLARGGFLENLVMCGFAFLFTLRYQPWLARTRLRLYYVGVGAFNLIHRRAYEAIGTHRRLAMEVVDDVKLGKLVKDHGLRQDVLGGAGALRVRYQIGIGGVIGGLTKNAFASLNFSLTRLVATTALALALFLGPYSGLLAAGSWGWWAYLACAVSLHTVFGVLLDRSRLAWWNTVFLPLLALLFVYVAWRSAWITLRDGGVTWRATFYRLRDLRRGLA